MCVCACLCHKSRLLDGSFVQCECDGRRGVSSPRIVSVCLPTVSVVVVVVVSVSTLVIAMSFFFFSICGYADALCYRSPSDGLVGRSSSHDPRFVTTPTRALKHSKTGVVVSCVCVCWIARATTTTATDETMAFTITAVTTMERQR